MKYQIITILVMVLASISSPRAFNASNHQSTLFPCSTNPSSRYPSVDELLTLQGQEDNVLEWLAETWSHIKPGDGPTTAEEPKPPFCITRDKIADIHRSLQCLKRPLNVSELILKQGYPVEEHSVHTEDGFILGMQRIPHGRRESKADNCRRPAVILQHGLFACSSNWVSNLANQSLAFILADAGYDVWLGNVRGNTYSRLHERYKPHQKEFWYWSWDEMGKYDLPAMVDYTLKVTRHRELFYVGHSQGTTIAFAELSSKHSSLSKKIKLFVALAPVAKVANIFGVFRSIAESSLCCFAKDVLSEVHLYEFLPRTFLVNTLAGETVCAHPKTKFVCEFFFDMMGGYSCAHMNSSRLPVYVGNNPAGTSIYDVEHYCQMVLSDKFQKYNFGPEENLRRYGRLVPPLYHPKNIRVPVAFFSGGKDKLADVTDVEWIRRQLGKRLIYDKFLPSYSHIDFILAIDAQEFVYYDIIDLFKKFEPDM